MKRFDIINTIGKEYLVSNIENDEFSYQKALKEIGKSIDDLQETYFKRRYQNIDLRFVYDNLSILIETKVRYTEADFEQLQAYITYEKQLNNNYILAILANTSDDDIKVWFGDHRLEISDKYCYLKENKLKSVTEYKEIFLGKENDKLKVMKSTYSLNELLHNFGIQESLRSQFVGTCLLALKNGLQFENMSTKTIIAGIEEILEGLLERDINKAVKIGLIKTNILSAQDIRELKKESFQKLLNRINEQILPYINEKTTAGQDILNLFFTTFNKYVGKADKNQAFTPDHIVKFMCDIAGVNRYTKVLDPCCGSGAFLVRAMTDAMDDCDTEEEKQNVKKNNIYGFEFEDAAFGLATTNMLLHSDGNSNIVQGSCFDYLDQFDVKKSVENTSIDIVLMNPPYNAQRKQSKASYVETWGAKTKTDPSKGFHFVYEVAQKIGTGKLLVLLPTSCAIGGDKQAEINKFKEKMLNEHTLDAVFSLPVDIFHPGANATACCMVFNLGIRHSKALNKKTFFGYFKDDGFIKRKNLGRVERFVDGKSLWEDIYKEWKELYINRSEKTGLSVLREVTAKDEWLAEAYMETDYSSLTQEDFERNIKELFAFEVKYGQPNIWNTKVADVNSLYNMQSQKLDVKQWKSFTIKDLFGKIIPAKGETTDQLEEGSDLVYIGAKKENNGVKAEVEYDKKYISEGNSIVFINLGQGSAGFTTYQPYDFIGMNGKISLGKFEHLNQYIGVFLVTILDKERFRYSFGRSWTGDRLLNTQIKLPVDVNGKPDWSFMETYIKSLPYGNMI